MIATFTAVARDGQTVQAWRSPTSICGRPLVPYYSPETPVMFILDRLTGCPWFALAPANEPNDAMSLAPAPYLGALSIVLSDLLTEEES